MRIVGPIIIIGLVAYMAMSSSAAITKQNIEKNLQSLAKFVEKQAADSGREGKLTYGDVVFEGIGFGKRAIIHNVTLSLAEKSMTDTSKWSLSTASVVVVPDAFLDEKLFFHFPDPINVTENSDLRSTISFLEAPKFSYFDGTIKNVHSIEQVLTLPEKITITPALSVDDTTTPKTGVVEIAFDKSPVINSTVLPDSKERIYNLDIKNIKVSSAQTARLVASNIASHYSEKQVDENTLEGKYTLSLVEVLLLNGETVMKPYTFAADLNIKSKVQRTAETAEKPAITTTNLADVAINKLSLLSSEFEIKAEGKASAAVDDPLFFGDGTVTITNAGNAVASDIIPQQAKGPVSMALQKLTGAPVEAETQVSLPLKREKNGIFYINTMTFEELANSIFTDLMNAEQSQTAPAAQDDSSVPTTLPNEPPAAAAGAAPVSPVISKAMEKPEKPSPAEEFQKGSPAKTVGDNH
ncbi:MAG: hypothetical protein EBR02_02690 [Alphaproteobacteria bacterium]|nr:hypothetical protein [Alphaproteobacteria bacterium]